MSEHYPIGKDYEVMYRKYFRRSPLELINLVKINKGDKIVDLCGGTGRLTKELLKMDCETTYVDASTCMILPELLDRVERIHMGAEIFFEWCENKYNGVFCQQGVNYWLTEETAKLLAKIIVFGGFFVFNTFWRRPNDIPTMSSYEINDKRYVEVAYHINGMVHHVQCCEGYPPHITQFAYISPEEIKEWLGKYFKLTEHKKGNTVIWHAERL